MARFIINAPRHGCSVDGVFNTLEEAKAALLKAVDEDIKSCEVVSRFEIFDKEQSKVVYRFAQENASQMEVSDLQKRIKALLSDGGNSNPNTLRYVAELCGILATKLEVAGF